MFYRMAKSMWKLQSVEWIGDRLMFSITNESGLQQQVSETQLISYVSEADVAKWIANTHPQGEDSIAALKAHVLSDAACEVKIKLKTVLCRKWDELCQVFGYFKDKKKTQTVFIHDLLKCPPPTCLNDYETCLNALVKDDWAPIVHTLTFSNFDAVISTFEQLQIDKELIAPGKIQNELCDEYFATFEEIKQAHEFCVSESCKQALGGIVQQFEEMKNAKLDEYVAYGHLASIFVRRSDEEIRKTVSQYWQTEIKNGSIDLVNEKSLQALECLLYSLNTDDDVLLFDLIKVGISDIVDKLQRSNAVNHDEEDDIFVQTNERKYNGDNNNNVQYGLKLGPWLRQWLILFFEHYDYSLRRQPPTKVSIIDKWCLIYLLYEIRFENGDWDKFMPAEHYHVAIGDWKHLSSTIDLLIHNYQARAQHNDELQEMIEYLVEHVILHKPGNIRNYSLQVRPWIQYLLKSASTIDFGCAKVVDFTNYVPLRRKFKWCMIIGDFIMWDCNRNFLESGSADKLIQLMRQVVAVNWSWKPRFQSK